MLVRYFTSARAPHGHVESVLGNLEQEIADSATDAYREGEELHQRMEAGGGVPAKDVLLNVGQARIRRDGLAFPVTWRATGPTMLFPRMAADLVVAPIDERSTSCVFEGTYEPPLGFVGGAFDRLVMNRLAEMTVKIWVDRVVDLAERTWVEEQRHHIARDGDVVPIGSDGNPRFDDGPGPVLASDRKLTVEAANASLEVSHPETTHH
jgi:hypothetical protein